MDIIIERKDSYLIVIDGKSYTTGTLADRVGVHRSTLVQGLSNSMKISNAKGRMYIENIMFKYNNKVPMNDHPYRNKDGCLFAVVLLLPHVPGLNVPAARGRISRWAKGEIDSDGLFLPAQMGAGGIRVPNRVGISTNATTRAIQEKLLEGMPPRRDVKQLGKIGTWEKNLPEPSNGVMSGSKRGVCAKSSKGTIYAGD